MYPRHEGLRKTSAAQAADRGLNNQRRDDSKRSSSPAGYGGRLKSTIHRVHRTLSKASLHKAGLPESHERTSKPAPLSAPVVAPPPSPPSDTNIPPPGNTGDVSEKTKEKNALHAADDDDDPWDGRAILALDGGGVRGLASLFVLRRLMDVVARIEKDEGHNPHWSALETRPCHYFDLIGGTSTGGLVAIMLGRLRMTVEEALTEYKKLGENFSLNRGHSWFKPRKWSSLEPGRYEEIIQKAFKQMQPEQSSVDEQDKLFRSDPMRCKTVVCSMLMNPSVASVEPVLFRSYPIASGDNVLAKNADSTGSSEIWQVARATSAAPRYFKPYSSDESKYTDPAPYICNPSWEVYKEFTKSRDISTSHIDLFLSIGSEATSHTLNKTQPGKLRRHVVNKMLKRAATIQKFADVVDEAMRRSNYSEFWYRRVNVEAEAIDGESLEKSCEKFVQRPDIQKELEESAFILVKMRKRRENTVFWEQFAEGVRYICPICPGDVPGYFQTRVELKDHLQAAHGMLSDSEHHEAMQRRLDEGRRAGSFKSGHSSPERQPSN